MGVKPTIGAFCVAYGLGPYLWLETLSLRAKDARRKMGEIMRGVGPERARIETVEEGWAYARKRGYRVVKVDVVAHIGAKP